MFWRKQKKSGTYWGGREGQNVTQISILKHLLSKIRKFYRSIFFSTVFSIAYVRNHICGYVFEKRKKSSTYHVGGRVGQKVQKNDIFDISRSI